MTIRSLIRPAARDAVAHEATLDEALTATGVRWRWIDIEADALSNEIEQVAAALELDALAITDALEDSDIGKVDDFGDHLLVVLHGLRTTDDDVIALAEIDCFITSDALVTIRQTEVPSLDRLWEEVARSPQLGTGGPDDLLARLADVVTRRLLAVAGLVDDHLDTLVLSALRAHPNTVANVTSLRGDLNRLRRAARPQRDVLDALRHHPSPLLAPTGLRRLADAHDVSERLIQALDAGRSGLADALDAYRGAEAQRATEVTRVLTVYAAVLLPLSLVVGFFGMNFENLPLLDRSGGWEVVIIGMGIIAAVSLGMFVAIGWIRPFSARRAGATIGRGLLEVSKAPVQLVGALYEAGTTPLRRVVRPTIKNNDET